MFRGFAEFGDGAGFVLVASHAGRETAPEIRLRRGEAGIRSGPELGDRGGRIDVGPGSAQQAFAKRVHRVGVALRDGLPEKLDRFGRVLFDRELSGAERLSVFELLDGVSLLGLFDVDARESALRGAGTVSISCASNRRGIYRDRPGP